MTESKQPQTAASPAQLNLVSSSRLQSLRKQATAYGDDAGNPSVLSQRVQPGKPDDAATKRLRQQVENRLQEIIATLPAGKQRSLFKIRYGVALDELEQLPVQKVAAILKILPDNR